MNDNFCVFILSHGRPDDIKTLKSLKTGNYTGKYFIIVDNEDKKQEEYKKLYKDKVIIFDKLEISKKFDTADNFSDRRSVVYARNACFEIAKKMGIEYFLQLDDDYTVFHFRKIENEKFVAINCLQLNKVFNSMIEFLEKTNSLTIAFAQGGDFVGGKDNGNFKKGLLRKAMNTFFCKTSRKFDFLGRINEDVNCYTSLSQKGNLFLTVTQASIVQAQTQQNKGGMTELYLDNGTYVKSFYSVIFSPSSVKIGYMGPTNKRLHHKICWNNTIPQIIKEEYKKK